MGLRLFSLGSLVADGISVAALAVKGIGTDSLLGAFFVVGTTILPPACYLAGKVLRRMEKPTPELARQLAGFEADFIGQNLSARDH